MTTRPCVLGLLIALALAGCGSACNQPTSAAQPSSAPGAQPTQTTQAPQPVQTAAQPAGDRGTRAAEAGDLIDAANKKLNREDGAGCLADLDRARALDEKTEARAAMTRASCEMAMGRCQAGKQRAAAWHRENSKLPPEMIDKTVEGLASMHCRGGDMTPRDQVLQAIFELSQGAYMTTRDAPYCSARVALLRRLAPQVPPQDPRDEQVKNALTVACTAGATCLGRAGDCTAAYRAFEAADCPVAQGIARVPDAVERKKAMVQAFESVVPDCKGKAP